MEEQELDIIEIEDEFHADWMNDKLRSAGVFGNLKDKLIPTKSGGYVLPNELQRVLEPYVLYLYTQAAGGKTIVQSEETYYIHQDNVRLEARAMTEVPNDGMN